MMAVHPSARDIPESHLYPGFRFAGRLKSIFKQRLVQTEIIATLQPTRLLSVGCAYGDELEQVLTGIDLENPEFTMTATDIANVGSEVCLRKFAVTLGSRFTWLRLALQESDLLGTFDVVQCGFVLHDISPAGKDGALAGLAKVVSPGGYLIISDFFLLETHDVPAQKREIYTCMIEEAEYALQIGHLEQSELQALLGDGTGPGLLSTREEAMCEERDYFDTLSVMRERAERFGFQLVRKYHNTLNRWLAILVMQRLQY